MDIRVDHSISMNGINLFIDPSIVNHVYLHLKRVHFCKIGKIILLFPVLLSLKIYNFLLLMVSSNDI